MGKPGTCFYAAFLRLMGMRVGSNVYIGSALITDWDLITLEDGTLLEGVLGVLKKTELFVGSPACAHGTDSLRLQSSSLVPPSPGGIGE